MPVNEIQTFALDAGANVMSQADYEPLVARLTGFQPGIARSEQLNKVWRQSAYIAAMIGRFVVENAAVDVRDDGDMDTLIANFALAVQAAASAGGGDAPLKDWIEKTANYTAYNRDRIFAETGAGGFTIQLPAAPVALQTEVWIKGHFAANNLIVDGNGSQFNFGAAGLSNTLTLNKDNLLTIITYDNHGHWRI